MLNKIFFWLLCIGVIYGFCKGICRAVTTLMFDVPQLTLPAIGPVAMTSRLSG